jgi:hypothetical protein
MVAAAHTADLKNLDIRTIRPDTLEHIENVKINTDLPVEERMMEFVRQIKNPYFFRCGKLIVQVEYSDTDKTINDCLKEFIESQIS